MKDFREQEWYQDLEEKMIGEQRRNGTSIFVAFYFYLFREPTKEEYKELWGSDYNYWTVHDNFIRYFKPFME